MRRREGPVRWLAVPEAVEDREWYHTIALPGGVLTPGWFDTRKLAARLPIPASLAGMRCLDVGTFDGFWAFEMERRGAQEVVALDVLDPRQWDWPVGSPEATIAAIGRRKDNGQGFEIARRALGSGVLRVEGSVYDLEQLGLGQFDFICMGSLLIHLRDPVLALERLRGVCRGQLLQFDPVDLGLTLRSPRRPVAELDGLGRPWWWKPNRAGLRRLLVAGGYDVLSGPRIFFMPPGGGQGRARLRPGSLASRPGREALLRTRIGDPHAAILARPRLSEPA